VIPFKIHILGCGSALPTLRHNATCQIVEIRGKYFMIDCGEGTQIQVRRTKVHFSKIQAVFISHLHGDHCFGLFGMISTFGMTGRTAPLHVYAPKEFEEYFNLSMELFCKKLEFSVMFHPVETTEAKVIYEDKSLTIESIPLEHRIPCCGFLFREKLTTPHIRRDMIDFYNIPISQINNIKAGANWTTANGDIIMNSKLTIPADKPRSYAYCSDTRYMEQLYKNVANVDVLYHESTFLEDNRTLAERTKHSTALQAAQIAKAAEAQTLILGHYSSRYKDKRVFQDEAKTLFTNTLLSEDGKEFNFE